MKLSAYLSPSRHGVYYFRWPFPRAEDHKRRTVRIPLRTKCPDRAGDLARHLASCGRLMRENKILARLRQYEMRDIVRTYFAASLDRYVERLNATGLPDRSLDALRQEMRKARRDQIKAILSAAESLEGYSFRTRSDGAKAATGRSVSLSAAITDFKAEHGPQWSQEMRNKADAYLALLVEFFRPDKGMDQITRHPRRGGGSCN